MHGTLAHHPDFESQYVIPRNVDVWLPPDYFGGNADRFPVLYMHDGQNLFDPSTSFIGVDWGVGEAMTRLIAENKLRKVIVVGIWNTAKRLQEYLPQRPFEWFADRTLNARQAGRHHNKPVSDGYLRFLIDELKPFIDRGYRTFPGRANTFIMGSSMGGLVSLYALCEHPGVFGGAGCLSTHWPAVEGIMVDYLKEKLPAPGVHKVYFDYGTETIDTPYEGHQRQIDTVMRAIGYVEGRDWITRKFEGAEHSERSWRERIHIPLIFFFGKL